MRTFVPLLLAPVLTLAACAPAECAVVDGRAVALSAPEHAIPVRADEPSPQRLANGTEVVDVRIGSGAVAASGRKVVLGYVGTALQ